MEALAGLEKRARVVRDGAWAGAWEAGGLAVAVVLMFRVFILVALCRCVSIIRDQEINKMINNTARYIQQFPGLVAHTSVTT